MELEKKTGRRNRRKKADLDSNLLEAAKDVIKEVGFNNSTIVGIAQKANVQATVFYNRYNDLDDFFDKLVREYDYWLNDSIQLNQDGLTPTQNFENGMIGLIDSFLENKIMQQLLIWEISSDNYITRRTTENRERNSKYLIKYFDENFKDSAVDFNVFTAILISGIYYLILRKDVSTFCSVDFGTSEGIEKLKDTIRNLVKKVYGNEDYKFPDSQAKLIRSAKNLYKKGVDIHVIQDSMGLSDEVISAIISQKSENEVNINDEKTNMDGLTSNTQSKKRRSKTGFTTKKVATSLNNASSTDTPRKRGRPKKLS